MTTKISYAIAFITGLGIIFLGVRFFSAPEAATAAFGIHFNSNGDYSFDHIKGIRDIFSGLLVCALVLMRERRALGVTLLAAAIIPVNDMLIVLSKSYNGISQAMPHIMAIIICTVVGILLLSSNQSKKAL
jgi:glucose uptake protein GlcU